jgi:hypothetical protein
MVQECLTRWCMYRLCKHLEPVELMTLAALSVNMSGRRREHEVNTDEHSYPFGRSFLEEENFEKSLCYRFLKCWSFKTGKEVPTTGHQCFQTTRNTAPLRHHTHTHRERKKEREGGSERAREKEKGRESCTLALRQCASRSSQLPCDATHTHAHTHTHTHTHMHTHTHASSAGLPLSHRRILLCSTQTLTHVARAHALM